MILVVDNYDSFTFNLVQYLAELGATLEVRRNDAITVEEAHALQPRGVLLGPGPGRPEDAGVTLELLKALQTPVDGAGGGRPDHSSGAAHARTHFPCPS